MSGYDLCACGQPATANGRECPAHFLARLRSIRVDTQNFDTAGRDRTYYDREAVQDVFGEHAREKMLEATDGLGYAKSTRDGAVYHRNRRTGEVEQVDDRTLDAVYLGGRTERPVE